MQKISALLLLMFSVMAVIAQTGDDPVAHMSALNTKETELSEKYMSYMSEVAHGRRARKMEKRRAGLIAEIQVNIREGGRLRPYKGDVSLRNAYVQYWNILLHVFPEDYHKIVDMEELAERSYDVMEAYILAQEAVDQKINEALEKVVDAYKAFASKHGVTLREGGESKLDKKLARAGKVNRYVNELFLIYFKSAVQESNLSEALSKGDVNSVEQIRSSLAKYSEEGLLRLDSVRPFNNDGSLITACRKVLQFHKDEAATRIPPLSEFLIKSGEFDKLRKSFERMPPASRTREDVDNYNKAVNEFNQAVPVFNKNSEQLFNTRNKVIENWEISRKRFMDLHMPHD